MDKMIKESIARVEKHYSFASLLIQKISRGGYLSSTFSSSTNVSPVNVGFVYKAFNGEYFTEVAMSGFSEELLKKAEEKLIAKFVPVEKEFDIDPGEIIDKEFSQNCKIDPTTIDDKTILEKAKSNRELIESKGDFSQVLSLLRYKKTEEQYFNRNKSLKQTLYLFTTIYKICASHNSKSFDIFGGHGKIGGMEHSDINLKELEKDIQTLENLKIAKEIIPGLYDCVIDPSVSGLVAHEAFGHGTESDMFLKDRAKGAEYIGKRVGSELVTMIDSSDMNDNENANASFFFDNDGTLACSTTVLDKGILKRPMTDKYSASKLGLELSANSRVEDYSHKSYARMTNTIFKPGTSKVEDMIKSIDRGFYISKGNGGMEDPKGWGMQVQATLAEEIVDGKLTGNFFSPVTLTGYLPDILNSVTMISDEFKFSTLGMCGKGEKEWVKVTEGGPHMKLKVRLV